MYLKLYKKSCRCCRYFISCSILLAALSLNHPSSILAFEFFSHHNHDHTSVPTTPITGSSTISFLDAKENAFEQSKIVCNGDANLETGWIFHSNCTTAKCNIYYATASFSCADNSRN